MNIICLSIFVSLFAVFVVAMFVIKKISIQGIISVYFRNYYSNAKTEEDRKFNIWFFLALGLLPFALGILMFFSFKDFFMMFDTNLLFQIDIILLTIFCLFIGFDFKREDKPAVKKELVATLLVNIIFIVLSVVILLIASSIRVGDDTAQSVIHLRTALFAIYYSLNFKVFVLFFYSLKRMFVLSSKE